MLGAWLGWKPTWVSFRSVEGRLPQQGNPSHVRGAKALVCDRFLRKEAFDPYSVDGSWVDGELIGDLQRSVTLAP